MPDGGKAPKSSLPEAEEEGRAAEGESKAAAEGNGSTATVTATDPMATSASTVADSIAASPSVNGTNGVQILVTLHTCTRTCVDAQVNFWQFNLKPLPKKWSLNAVLFVSAQHQWN